MYKGDQSPCGNIVPVGRNAGPSSWRKPGCACDRFLGGGVGPELFCQALVTRGSHRRLPGGLSFVAPRLHCSGAAFRQKLQNIRVDECALVGIWTCTRSAVWSRGLEALDYRACSAGVGPYPCERFHRRRQGQNRHFVAMNDDRSTGHLG